VWTGSSILGCTLRLHQCGPMKICEPLMFQSVGNTAGVLSGLAYTRPYSQAVGVRNPLVGIKRIDRINLELTNGLACSKVSSIASLHVWFLTKVKISACCHVPVSICPPTRFRLYTRLADPESRHQPPIASALLKVLISCVNHLFAM
jgi:hypothetical protein